MELAELLPVGERKLAPVGVLLPRKAIGGEAVLFASVAYQDGAGSWRAIIRGASYEPETVKFHKRLLVRLLRQVMKASPRDLEHPVFRDRIRFFIARTEGGKKVAIRLGEKQFILPKRTRRNGQFRGVVRLTQKDVTRLRKSGEIDGQWLQVNLASNSHLSSVETRVQLLPQQGISIISDIDDTIKITGVTDRRAMLENTFMRPFKPVRGMAKLYQHWSKQGAAFHYVSSSPWQLYCQLASFCDEYGMPQGSIHLRSFRLRDHMLRRVRLIRRGGKGSAILELLRACPHRMFYLIGDSGERDAEIYARVARRFPGQVAGILIRQLPERPLDSVRLEKAFRNIPTSKWRLFSDPKEVRDLLKNSATSPLFETSK